MVTGRVKSFYDFYDSMHRLLGLKYEPSLEETIDRLSQSITMAYGQPDVMYMSPRCHGRYNETASL